MQKKVFLSHISVLIVMMIFCTMVTQVSAILSPGPAEYELDRSYLLTQNGVTLSENDLIFEKDGSVCFDLLLPFDSDRVLLTYGNLAQTANLRIETDEHSYNCTLDTEANVHELAITETYGSNTLTLSADQPVTISSINFKKIDENFNKVNSLMSDLSDYEYALLTAIVIKDDAVAMKSKGAIRRLDMDNLYLTPMNIDGSLYVPLKVLAKEMSLYCEDYPDKAYVLLRGDGVDCALVGGKGYVETYIGGKRDIKMNIVYQDGVTWVPLRKLAETMGFFVAYRDGYAVIDDRLSARKIVEDEKIFAALVAELAPYIPCENATGVTYHVAKSKAASDANSGTEQYPFATIEKACEVAQAGDTVIIHEGTYREVLRPKNDGTALAPITFCAAEGEKKVVISALEPLTEFIHYKDNLYCACVPIDLGMGKNQLFYNGEALVEGRYPNEDTKAGIVPYPEGVPSIYPVRADIYIKEEGGSVATSDTDLEQDQKDYWKGGTFVTLKGFGWSLVSGDIIGSSRGELLLADHEGSKSYNLGTTNSLHFGNSGRFYENVHTSDYGYITNHINTVDIPGEWYMSDNMMYLYPPVNADLSKDFEVKQRQLTVDLRNKKFIMLKNIDTIGGGLTLSGENTEGCVLNGGTYKNISHFTRCIDPMRTYNELTDSFDMPGAPQRGEVGICLSGSNNAIINSNVDYSAASGIYIVGKYNYVDNNIVSNTSYTGSYPGGITITSENWLPDTLPRGGHTITNNTIFNSGRGALCNFETQNSEGAVRPIMACEIAYNRVYNGSLTARDTGVTYQYAVTAGNDKSRTKMHHNYVYNAGYKDEDTGHMLFLLYHDGLSSNQESYYNLTFYQNAELAPEQGTFNHPAPTSSVRLKNNRDLGYFPEGLEGLKTQHFPGGKPFFAGCLRDSEERFMLNYDNLKLNKSDSYYYPIVSETEGLPRYDFEDIYLKGGCCNRLMLDYTRKSGESSMLEVTAKVYDENGTLVVTGHNSLNLDSPFYMRNVLGEGNIFLPPVAEGKYNISIELSDTLSEVRGMQAEEEADVNTAMLEEGFIYAGSFDDSIINPSYTKLDKAVYNDYESVKNGHSYIMWNTWEHTAIFKDREFTVPVDTVDISYGTANEYKGQTLSIYADSLESEPIAVLQLSEDGGKYWTPTVASVPLSRTLEPGKHTFYLCFEGELKCSNVQYIRFYERGNTLENGEVMQ